MLWVILSRVWRDWRSALATVLPETVVAWQHTGSRLFWTWKGGRFLERTGNSCAALAVQQDSKRQSFLHRDPRRFMNARKEGTMLFLVAGHANSQTV
jgi:hypothetical protein